MRRALALAAIAVLLLAAPASFAFAARAATPATTGPSATTGTSATTAAPVSPRVVGKPVTPTDIGVQLWPEDVKGSTTLIVVALVPTSAPLPAAVSLPVPAGARITWAGEIFSTNEQDVPRRPDVARDERSIIITTQKSRIVQYEAQYKPFVDRNGRRYAQVDWVQTAPSLRTDFAFRLPPLTTNAKSDPPYQGEPAVNQSGEKLYTLAPQKLAVGQSFRLAIDYVPQLPDLGQQAKRGPDVLLISLFSVLALVVIALLVVVMRSRRPA